MSTTPPDPSSPSSPASPAGGGLPPTNGSTGSLRQAPSLGTGSSLSDLLRANAGLPTRRANAAADLAAQLLPAGHSSYPAIPKLNTDDQPTIISANPSQLAPPSPPYILGESPGIIGRTLGHYELIESIGAGGMAAVLKARDTELSRIVALKILPPGSALDAENVLRFKQEARAAAKLDHENIARVYYCGEDQGLHFIAFEFVEGINLRGLIDRRGTLSAAESVGYMIQIAAGLAHAAERGVVHRDIKPSNIIITPHGRAKIVDMGLARLDATPVNGGMTQSGVTLGTFDYISPEQALDPRRADVRSDLYSLGCTFYHALTGRPPVPEGTAAKKLYAHQQIPPLDPRELNPAIPDSLAIVLARMMMKDPDRRYQTPSELIADLKRLIDPAQLSTDFSLSDSVVRAIPASESVIPPAPRLPVGLLFALAAVLIIIVALSSTSPDSNTDRPPWAEPPATLKGLRAKATHNAAEATPVMPKGRPTSEMLSASTTEELIRHTRTEAQSTRIRLTGPVYDLTQLGASFVGEAGQTLVLEGTGSLSSPTVIQVAALPLTRTGERAGSLTFSGYGSVRLVNVRIVLSAPDVSAAADQAEAVGLGAVDVGLLTLTDCQFDASQNEVLASGAADVAVSRSSSRFTPVMKAERCLFLPGAVGVRLCPRAELTLDDCGFAPQTTAAVQIQPGVGEMESARVTLFRSSFMLDPRSAVVSTDGRTAVRVTAGYCVFAPNAPTADAASRIENRPLAGRAVVMRIDSDSPQGIRFDGEDGQRNVYCFVEPLGLRNAEGPQVLSFDDCRSRFWPLQDRGAVTLKRTPWAAIDLEGVWSRPADWHRAFRLLPENDLFVASSSDGVKFVGARFGVPGRSEGGLIYDAAPLVKPIAAFEVREKVWWPEPPRGTVLVPGTYDDLGKLLRDVRSGDTILIRHDGLLPVEPAIVARRGASDDKIGELNLTFKPYADPMHHCRPVLTNGPTNRLDVALLTLEDGEVHFEDLQFRITAGHQSVALARQVVSMQGAKSCSFRSCVLTLEEDGGKAAVVVIADPEARMSANGPTAVPRVRFDDCLIRGQGRGLWLPSSRAFELEASNTVTALEGPVLAIDHAAKVASEATSRVRFKHLTALLAGPILELRAGKPTDGATGLVPTHVEADECLFASLPSAANPLIEAEGLDFEAFRDALTWARPAASLRANWYANFEASTHVVEFNLAAEGMPSKKWMWSDWLSFGDRPVGTPVGKVTFASAPATARELRAVTPADLKVTAIDFPEMNGLKAGDTGANVELLPKPSE